MTSADRIVPVDSAMGTLPIFRPLAKSSSRAKLELTQTVGEVQLTWRGPNQLSIPDQSVLLAAMACAKGCEVLEEQRAEPAAGQMALALLEPTGHRFQTASVWIPTTFRMLSRHCAASGHAGPNTSQVKASLKRLTETTIWMRSGDREGSTRLLAWSYSQADSVLLTLNWRLVDALCGRRYSRINLHHRGLLATDVAKALHFSLSCQIGPGGSWAYKLDNLQRHVWGDQAEGEALRQRRTKLRKALEALAGLPTWSTSWNDNVVTIKHERTARPRVETSKTKTVASYRSRRVESVTVRSNESPSASNRFHSQTEKASVHEGLAYEDVSALFNTKAGGDGHQPPPP
ncbi:replication protein C, IncQ-type [Hydrogenophaga sp.]|uniref:replication protein C, IncQ-type n=1 Tax=Hydrogenophaga sp. TaxID=1904254 RepID=UPI001AD5CCD5|nr:replication protein C, IncQ-type [Hydrogenophaga sp.]MBN9372133.1 hypothetical protein [Hydrogenophaga sp.]